MSRAIAPAFDVEAVRSRLLATKQSGDAAAVEVGREWGRHWAANDATHRELERLASDESGTTDAAELYRVLGNDDGFAHNFWSGVFDDEFTADDPAAIRGFVEGAMEVWNAVGG
jgi:hypothetical protein